MATAIKAAEVISIVEMDVEKQDEKKSEILNKLAKVPVETHHDIVETLGAVDTVLTSGEKRPGEVLRRAGAETLNKVSQNILSIVNPTVNEKVSVEKQAELALVVAGKLLHMRKKPSVDANLETEKGVPTDSFSHETSKLVQSSLTTVAQALLKNKVTDEIINLTTPHIEVKAWKVKQNKTVGEKLEFRGVELELPEGLGGNANETVELSAVVTDINPEIDDDAVYASPFLDVKVKTPPGVPKKPIVLRFKRTKKVSLGKDSNNVALINMHGEARCVLYSKSPRRYGWRVLMGDFTGTVRVPTRGVARVKLVPEKMHNVLNNNLKMVFRIGKSKLGTECWPKELYSSRSGLFFTTKSPGPVKDNDDKDQLWIENSRSRDASLKLDLAVAYNNNTFVNATQVCDEKLAYADDAKPMPVKFVLRMTQMAGQCAVYDEVQRRFIPNPNCQPIPEVDSIVCICHGTSLHTTVSMPPTNTIDFTDIQIDLVSNAVPFIFVVVLLVAYFLLYGMAWLADIIDEKRM